MFSNSHDISPQCNLQNNPRIFFLVSAKSSIWQAFPISTAMTKMAQSVQKAGEKLLSASKKLTVAFDLTLLLSLELWTMVRKKGTDMVS